MVLAMVRLRVRAWAGFGMDNGGVGAEGRWENRLGSLALARWCGCATREPERTAGKGESGSKPGPGWLGQRGIL